MYPSARNNLPPEIIEEILPLLPPNSLCRFKSVSKKWNSLISSPHFIKTHLLLNHQTPKLIALSTTGSLYSIDITETLDSDCIPATANELRIRSPPLRWKQILGSCNGLLLAKDENDTIFVMNPMTQDLWEVPLCPFAPVYEEYEEVYVRYGFGYDLSTDDYKIVSISFWNPYSYHDSKETFVCVYSLRNNSWRKLPDCNYYEHDYTVLDDVISGAVINQSLHWSGRFSEIVGFNLASEEFKQMKFPVSVGFGISLLTSMVDVGGKLGVFMRSEEAGFECCVMEEYGVVESWTKVRIHGFEEEDRAWPVCLLQGRNREIVFQRREGGMVVYNIDERRRRDVRIVGGPGGNVNVFPGTFVESLESPKRVMIAS
ncbi:putative F-box domain-containing protein [Helianthus annuus]|nr:putative F-box domain-containing protein [Helianthus annuus]